MRNRRKEGRKEREIGLEKFGMLGLNGIDEKCRAGNWWEWVQIQVGTGMD